MKTLYIGAKCVPSFYIGSGGTSEWASGVPFEALTVVTYNGTWFISKKPVPAGAAAPEAGEYWAKVPGYVTDVTQEELQAILDDIGDLDDLDTTAKTDLVSAVNEVKGETTELRDDLRLSNFPASAKAALIEVLKRAVYLDEEAKTYLETFIEAIYYEPVSFEWYASSGSLPTGFTYESAQLVDNEYYNVSNPLFETGFCNSYVLEVECAFDTSNSKISNCSIIVADSPSHGNKLYFNSNGDITLASKTSAGVSNNLVISDVDITEFHKYKLEFDGNSTKLYIDNEYCGKRDSYSTPYVRMPIIYSNKIEGSTIMLKSIRYTLGDIVETDYLATVYKGIGLNSSTTPVSFVVNLARCITAPIYFVTSDNLTFSVDGPEGVVYGIKLIDPNGNIWGSNTYNGYDYEQRKASDFSSAWSSITGWAPCDDTKCVIAKRLSSAPTQPANYSNSTIPNTNGTFRIIFRKLDNSEFDEIPNIKITLYFSNERDVEYGVKEGDPNDIL